MTKPININVGLRFQICQGAVPAIGICVVQRIMIAIIVFCAYN